MKCRASVWPLPALAAFCLLSFMPFAAAQCEFLFNPKQVRSATGVEALWSRLIGQVSLQGGDNPIASREQYDYKLAARLMKPINPRLCKLQTIRNDVPELYFDETDITRVPLSKDHGLPEVRCMMNPTTVGGPVNFFPKFSRAGALTPPTSEAAKFPLCGDLFYFRRGQLLQFTGRVFYGTIQVLQCQSGEPEFADQYKMVSLFSMNCTQEILPTGYPSPQSTRSKSKQGNQPSKKKSLFAGL